MRDEPVVQGLIDRHAALEQLDALRVVDRLRRLHLTPGAELGDRLHESGLRLAACFGCHRDRALAHRREANTRRRLRHLTGGAQCEICANKAAGDALLRALRAPAAAPAFYNAAMNAVLEPRVRRPIRELPSELVSQIAAGEVVERPASVVRELLDNAIDAGATGVTVRLTGGGIRAIVVEDDGHGIPAAELPAALRRHATSKIASLADLEGVATMGFRGEALAAIASVAEVTITSRSDDAAHAMRLDAQSGELAAAARSVGTTVEVRELFFNTPARRKFLKTEATELAHCVEAVRRHALVRPDLAFAVWHDGKAVARWSRGNAEARTGDLLGAAFAEHSRAVAVDLGGLAITGRTGTPESARARADLQYVYVNGRHVRDKLIAHAVRAAYDDVLHGGRQPAYLLFIAVAPERVDVNVHPTKIEVRFRDSREVHEAVRKAVAAALAAAPGARASRDAEPVAAPTTMTGTTFAQRPLRWAESTPAQRRRCARPSRKRRPGSSARRRGTQRPRREPRPPTSTWPLGRALAQVAGTFILAENAQGSSSSTCTPRTSGSSTSD